MTADDGLGKANLVGGTQRSAHDRLGLVEVADFNSTDGRPWVLILSSSDPEKIAPRLRPDHRLQLGTSLDKARPRA
jgi:hypothetical protein